MGKTPFLFPIFFKEVVVVGFFKNFNAIDVVFVSIYPLGSVDHLFQIGVNFIYNEYMDLVL
jgi:hypothetical protein